MKFYIIVFGLFFSSIGFSQSYTKDLKSEALFQQDSLQGNWRLELGSGHFWNDVSPFGLGDFSETIGKSLLVNFGLLDPSFEDVEANFSGSIKYGSLYKRIKNGWIGIGVENNMEGFAAVPGDVFKLLSLGNANVESSSLNLAFEADYINYVKRYLAFGYSFDRLNVIAQVGWLSGHEHLHTSINTLQLNTESIGFDLALTRDFEIQNTAVLEGNGSDIQANVDIYGSILSVKNPGVSLDLFADFQYNDRLNILGFVENVGFISWKGVSYSKNDVVEFDGIDLQDIIINGDEFEFQDTLDELLEIDTMSSAYSTSIGYAFGMGAVFNYSRSLDFIGNLAIKNGFQRHILRGHIGAEYHFNKYISSQLYYAFSNRNFANVGLGVNIQYAFANVYIGVVNPWNLNNVITHRYSGVDVKTMFTF